MNTLLKGLLAGYGAKKLGGGCLGTIVVFLIIWAILGQCG
jgi:hypothetical protein